MGQTQVISKLDLISLLHGWQGKFELAKLMGKISFVEMIYEIKPIQDYTKSLALIEKLELTYGHQIPYELDTEHHQMVIKIKVTPQTLQDFLKIKHYFKEVDKKLLGDDPIMANKVVQNK